MKTNGVVIFAVLVFLLVVIPVNIERGFITSWQTELFATPPEGPPGQPPGPPPIPPGQDKDKDKDKDKTKPVPEPSTLILLGVGLAAGGAYSLFRRQKSKEQE